MKNTILIFILLLTLSTLAEAQGKRGRQYSIGVEIGPTGSLGFTSISNANIMSDTQIETAGTSFDYKYGGRISISRIAGKPFSSMLSIYSEYLFNTFKKEFDISIISAINSNYKKELEFKTADFIFAFRYIYYFGNHYGFPVYFDVGLSLTNFKKIDEKNSIENENFYKNSSYNENIKSAILGVGIYRKFINFGLRLNYGIDDLLGNETYMISDGVYDNKLINKSFPNDYKIYSPTKRVTVELKVEINLALFSFSRGSCGREGFNLFHFGTSPRYFWK